MNTDDDQTRGPVKSSTKYIGTSISLVEHKELRIKCIELNLTISEYLRHLIKSPNSLGRGVEEDISLDGSILLKIPSDVSRRVMYFVSKQPSNPSVDAVLFAFIDRCLTDMGVPEVEDCHPPYLP